MGSKSKRNQRKANRRQRTGRGGRSSVGGMRPPPFAPTVKVNHKFRFTGAIGSATTLVAITRANLLNLLVTAISAITTVRTFEAVRLKKVEMWTNAPALGSAPTYCQLEWEGENSPSTILSDTSMGVQPAHLVSIPPPSSSNRWWSMSGSQETDNLFGVMMSTGGVIDVSVEARLVDVESPTAGPVPAGATIGQLYACTLDGNGVGGVLSPLGYNALP